MIPDSIRAKAIEAAESQKRTQITRRQPTTKDVVNAALDYIDSQMESNIVGADVELYFHEPTQLGFAWKEEA